MVIVAAIIVALALVELALRAFAALEVGPSAFLYGSARSRTYVDAASGVGYSKYRPGQTRMDRDPTGNRFRVGINRRGFRGPDFDTTKPPNTVRVVTLGASSTFGYYDRDHETYPHYLGRILNQTAAPGTRFEVINLGIPHLNAEQIHALFLAEAVPLDPDIVTFYEGVNDARLTDGVPGIRSSFLRLTEISMVASLVNDVVTRLPVRRFSATELEADRSGKADRFVARIEKTFDECRRRNIVFIVAPQQAQSHLLPPERMRGVTMADEVRLIQEKLGATNALAYNELNLLIHDELMARLRAWASARHVPVADVVRALDRDRDYLMSWVHLHPHGNRIVAVELAKTILACLGRDPGEWTRVWSAALVLRASATTPAAGRLAEPGATALEAAHLDDGRWAALARVRRAAVALAAASIGKAILAATYFVVLAPLALIERRRSARRAGGVAWQRRPARKLEIDQLRRMF